MRHSLACFKDCKKGSQGLPQDSTQTVPKDWKLEPVVEKTHRRHNVVPIHGSAVKKRTKQRCLHFFKQLVDKLTTGLKVITRPEFIMCRATALKSCVRVVDAPCQNKREAQAIAARLPLVIEQTRCVMAVEKFRQKHNSRFVHILMTPHTIRF